MKSIIAITLIIVATTLNAQDINWLIGDGGPEMERSWDITTTGDQGVIITGQFTGNLEIEGQTYENKGISDIFVIKYNEDGNMVWVTTFGSDKEDVALDIETDSENQTYVTGYFTGSMIINGTTHTPVGWDIFLIKIDESGKIITMAHPECPGSEIGYGLSIGANNQIAITGWFQDTISFSGETQLASHGGSDILIAVYNSDLNFQWAKNAGTEGVEYGYKISSDQWGNFYVTGVAGPGTAFDDFELEAEGVYIAKYNSQGDATGLTYHSGNGVNSISSNHSGEGYITGRLTGSATFPAENPFSISSYQGTDDGYVAQFDTALNWNWAKIATGPGSNKGRAVFSDAEGNAFVAGSFQQEITLNDTTTISGLETDNAYLAKYSNQGDLKYVKSSLGTGANIPTAVAQKNETAYLSGWFAESLSFDSTLATTNNIDLFLVSITEKVNGTYLSTHINNKAIYVYPNPAKDFIKISGENLAIDSQISIYNSHGKVITKTNSVNAEKGINLQKIPAGLYVVLVENSHQNHTIIFIKQ